MALGTVIQLRRDTAANWTSSNVVLANGEPGVETDTGKFKIGNGSTAWNSLSYLTGTTDTLSDVTGRGSTTSSAISITNTTATSSASTGALIVSGGVGIGGDIYIAGSLTVSGTSTTVNTNNLAVTDSLIYLSKDQFDTDVLDIGIFGAYGDVNPGHVHTGLIRDASDGIWKLVSNGPEPVSNVIDFTGITYDILKIGSLQVTDASTTRSNLGLIIGTDVQAYNSSLSGIAALGSGTGLLKNTAGTWSYDTNTYLTTSTASSTYEPKITAGTTSQYWRGDKSWQTLDKTAVGLSNVENTALSTWAGSANITTLGTITTGTWSATAIADNKIASALTGKTYNGLTLTSQTTGFTIAGGTTSKTLTVALDASVSGTNTGDQTISLTGDVTGSGTGSFATTLATVNSNVGSFTNASITVDAKGRITAASSGTSSGLSANNPTLTRVASLVEGGQINWEPSTEVGSTTWFQDSYWNGSATQLRIGNGTTIIASFDPAGTFSVPTGSILPMTGSSTEAPIDFSPGTNLATPAQGAMEFDGSNLFITGNTSTGSGRQVIYAPQSFKAQSSGVAAISGTAASVFGATNRPALLANHTYHFKYIIRYGTKTTAGTLTYNFALSTASAVECFAEVKAYASGAAVTAGTILALTATTTTGTVTGSIANNATNVMVVVEGYITPSANMRVDLQALTSSGSVAQLTTATSNYVFTDLGDKTVSYGNFA